MMCNQAKSRKAIVIVAVLMAVITVSILKHIMAAADITLTATIIHTIATVIGIAMVTGIATGAGTVDGDSA